MSPNRIGERGICQLRIIYIQYIILNSHIVNVIFKSLLYLFTIITTFYMKTVFLFSGLSVLICWDRWVWRMRQLAEQDYKNCYEYGCAYVWVCAHMKHRHAYLRNDPLIYIFIYKREVVSKYRKGEKDCNYLKFPVRFSEIKSCNY